MLLVMAAIIGLAVGGAHSDVAAGPAEPPDSQLRGLMLMRRFVPFIAALIVSALVATFELRAAQPTVIVLENACGRLPGTGSAPIERARIVIRGDRIDRIGTVDDVASRLALRPSTCPEIIVPGLHPSALSYRVDRSWRCGSSVMASPRFAIPVSGTSSLLQDLRRHRRRSVAGHDFDDPAAFNTGERPAYPADSVVARDAEARRLAERNVAQGASALKIYFRLPFASAKAVIHVRAAHRIPCTAHLEILNAGELFAAGLHGFSNITSLGTSAPPQVEAR